MKIVKKGKKVGDMRCPRCGCEVLLEHNYWTDPPKCPNCGIPLVKNLTPTIIRG